MERTDWLQASYDSCQARFLMLTAMTRHDFYSPAWGEAEVRRLYAELTEIDAAVAEAVPVGRSPRGSRALASCLFPAARPAGGRAASRMSRVRGWLRLGFGRNRSVRGDASPAERADWPS